jgi:nucleoside-triphosphatase THEP1
MNTQTGQEIVYGINVDDIQEVAEEVLERPLTDAELILVKASIGDYIDWFQAIENAIQEHVPD